MEAGLHDALQARPAEEAAEAAEAAEAPVPWAALPPVLLRQVLLRLPVRCRARASCVCRAWYDVCARPVSLYALESEEDWCDANEALLNSERGALGGPMPPSLTLEGNVDETLLLRLLRAHPALSYVALRHVDEYTVEPSPGGRRGIQRAHGRRQPPAAAGRACRAGVCAAA